MKKIIIMVMALVCISSPIFAAAAAAATVPTNHKVVYRASRPLMGITKITEINDTTISLYLLTKDQQMRKIYYTITDDTIRQTVEYRPVAAWYHGHESLITVRGETIPLTCSLSPDTMCIEFSMPKDLHTKMVTAMRLSCLSIPDTSASRTSS